MITINHLILMTAYGTIFQNGLKNGTLPEEESRFTVGVATGLESSGLRTLCLSIGFIVWMLRFDCAFSVYCFFFWTIFITGCRLKLKWFGIPCFQKMGAMFTWTEVVLHVNSPVFIAIHQLLLLHKEIVATSYVDPEKNTFNFKFIIYFFNSPKHTPRFLVNSSSSS